MERRRTSRIRRRLSCEFFVDGGRYTGIVVDLSATGLFVRTDAALEPGTEVEVHLDGSRFPEVTLQAVVARRRLTPALLSSVLHRGLGLRITNAPEAFYTALQASDGTLAAAIEVVVRDGPDPGAEECETDAPQMQEPPLPAPHEARRAVREPEERGRSGGHAALERAEPPEESRAAALEARAEDLEPEPERDAIPRVLDGWVSPPSPYPSRAIVVDDGELDDVQALLIELGANPVRHCGKDPSRFRGWVSAPRIFVTTARNALSLRLPQEAEANDVVPIAVAEADSQVLLNRLRRQGFRYVVRRPVHPEALRLMLMRSLYRDPEHRAELRVPLGCEVTWRSSWRTRRGMLVEISSSGCRLLSPVALEPASRVSVCVPPEVAGGRKLRLTGRVVRFERLGSGQRLRDVALAITFEPFSERTRQRLMRLLEERSGGPLPLPRKPAPRPVPARSAESAPRAEEPGRERRLHPRVALDREVVTLDDERRVEHVLVGRDLSEGGLRVDPHPEVRVGDKLRIALYDASVPEPLVLDSEVTREDGERGVVLEFQEPRRPSRRRLRAMVAALPAVEDLRSRSAKPRGVVLAEIVTRRRRI